MTVRTRFAPSPTGSLHIGNVRSGLFAYLYARHNHGKFILRIDDTDRERSTEQSLDEILTDLKWLGMEWDEGPPDAAYFQTNRVARHREAALKLLRERKAYPCYCSAEELDAKRKQAEREHRRPVYDRKCRGLDFPADLPLPDKAAGRNYTIRFAMPLDGETVVDDLVKGRIVFQNAELDDFIIVRSDGSPIYNFASILDDVDMRITHIVRGDDHVSNTPRQMQMAYALGFTPPAFAHLPQVLGPDGSPLSKRHGATSVVAYRENGYFPEAMLNYLARLGWSHGDQEIFSKDELTNFFGFEACGKSAGVFNAEKLLWLNFHYLKERPLPKLVQEVKPFIAKRGWLIPGNEAWLEKAIATLQEHAKTLDEFVGFASFYRSNVALLAKAMPTLQERAKTLDELAEFASFYLKNDIQIDPKAAEKFLKPEVMEPLRALSDMMAANTGQFSEASVQSIFESVLGRFGMKMGQLAQPVRVALTGGTVSPGIYEVIAVLGQRRTVERLRAAVAKGGKNVPNDATMQQLAAPPQLSMLEVFECQGHWWTDSDRPVPGRLTFSPSDGIKLELIGTLDPFRSGPVRSGSHAVIWGRAVQGFGITLFGTLEANSSFNLAGEKTSTYRCAWMIVGEHAATSDAVTFSEVEVQIFNLEEWVNLSGIVLDTLATHPGHYAIRYEQRPVLKFSIGSFTGCAEAEGHYDLRKLPPSAAITEQTRLKISSDKEQHVDNFINGPVRSLLYLEQLAIGSRVPLISLSGTSDRLLQQLPNGVSRRVPISVLFAQKKAFPLPERAHPGHMLFTASALQANFNSLINKWHSGRDRYPATLDFHFSIDPQRDPEIPLEFKFFSAFVACEAYHRATRSNEQLEPSEYKRRRELLLSAVESDPNLQSWANEKILGNEPSARRRLEELFDEQPSSVQALVDKNSFLKRAVATRNRGIVHGYADPDAFAGAELFRATLLLRLMLQTCLLREIGFSPLEVEHMVPRITEYRILSMS